MSKARREAERLGQEKRKRRDTTSLLREISKVVREQHFERRFGRRP